MPIHSSEPRLYRELAAWWPLLSPPSHYVEEAAELLRFLAAEQVPDPAALLELGCGGGSLAFHLKSRFTLTLTDRSAEMLANSRVVNPTSEHYQGDMRTLRLDQQFDVVLIHDAIMYLTTPDDLQAAFRTAWEHCRPGGLAVLIPDFVQETFAPGTDHGGEDGPDGRGLRYLEWTWDADPGDGVYEVAFAFLLRHADGSVTTEGDLHREGLFPRDHWLASLTQVGFEARTLRDSYGRDLFFARRPT